MLGVVLPFLLWLFKKKTIRNVDSVGRQVMNFQISWVLVYYVISITILSISFGKIALSGQISLFELNEILYLQGFKIGMYVGNIILILLSTYFVIRSGSSKVLRGFAFHRNKINPVFLVIYIILFVVLALQLLPKEDLRERPKEEIVEFAKDVIFIPAEKDHGRSKLMQ
jgi:uncharacterized Tic20 family protein